MPQLLNSRRERFCALVADDTSVSTAYTQAGYHPNNGNAYALRRKDYISARINELLAERVEQNAQATAKAAQELAITREWVRRRP